MDNPDIARRAQFIRVGPLSLPEAIFINAHHKYVSTESSFNLEKMKPNITLGSKIKTALFHFETAAQVYDRLQSIKSEVDNYWQQVNASQAINNYITNYETLPYVLSQKQSSLPPQNSSTNEIRISIRQTLEKVYNHDLNLIGQFDQSTRQHFPGLLLWLANSNQQSLTKMSQRMGLNVRTVQNMLEILVNSEILMAIPPLGSSSGKIAKPYKYLFTAPALRQALNNLPDDQKDKAQFNQLRGCLLEDTVGFYLKQVISDQPLGGLVEYDASRAGADFIVLPTHIKTEAIAIEIGWHKPTGYQVQSTLERIGSNSRYGLVITNGKLELDEKKQIVLFL